MAALLGNRYLQHLQIRGEHHGDLNKKIVQLWRRYVEENRRGNDWRQIRIRPMVAYGVGSPFDVERKRVVNPQRHSLPDRNPLWERSAEHWPDLHAQWERVQEAQIRQEAFIVRLMQKIEAHVTEDVPSIDQVKWTLDQPDLAFNGLRLQLVEFWDAFLEDRYHPFSRRLSQLHVEAVAGESRLRLNSGPIAIGPEIALSTLGDRIKDITSTQWRPPFDELIALTQAVAEEETKFLGMLDAVEFDRNLNGKCKFCPQAPLLVRALGRLVD
jgi:hypothetical protein